jgi:hypothetical protein
MKNTAWKVEKDGKLVPIWPEVKIGFERLNRNGPSKLSGSQVVCNEHGTRPCCWVNWRGILVRCCRKCILENCQVAKARLKSNWDGNGALDHPGGHSY